MWAVSVQIAEVTVGSRNLVLAPSTQSTPLIGQFYLNNIQSELLVRTNLTADRNRVTFLMTVLWKCVNVIAPLVGALTQSLSTPLFTSNGVIVGIVIGVIRALMTWWKSKIRVVSGVISSTESESKESGRFQFFRFRLRVRRLRSSETRLSESEAETEEPTNYKAWNRTLWLVYFSGSACDSDNAIFTRS